MILNYIWGWDATWNPPFPGDNGDWASYDAFLNRLIADVQASGMNPQWDIWNEPDLTLFWNRPQSQYLAMWQRGYQRIRQSFPNAVIVGPSTAGSPPAGSAWWNTFLDFVDDNDVVPNIVSWHALASDPFNGDPSTIRQAIDGMLAQRGIPRPYRINEYVPAAVRHPRRRRAAGPAASRQADEGRPVHAAAVLFGQGDASLLCVAGAGGVHGAAPQR